MACEWPIVRLGDYVDSSLGKMLDAKKNKGTPQPYLGNSNVRWGQFDLADLAQMRFEDHEEDRYSLRRGDLVVCEGGEPGRCAIWRGQTPMKIQKALHRVRAKDGLNNEYLYYWLTFAGRAGLLEPYFTGTTIKHLTGRALVSLEVPMPARRTQNAIVDLLRPLDDRIDLLRQTNTALEAIAQALFKSWFVDFDPVHAKTEGRAPEAMDAATAALFPSKFEESELGPIPKGWHAGRLGDISTNPRDKAKPGKIDPSTPYFGLEHMPRKSIALGDHGTAGGLGSSKFWFDESDILFGKLRPYFHKVGLAPFKGICSTDILVLRTLKPDFHALLLTHASSDAIINYATRLSNGAKMPRSSWKDIANYPMCVPPDSVAQAFNGLIKPLFERIKENVRESSTLSELRDTLLPRLISGKLRLPETTKAAEAAFG